MTDFVNYILNNFELFFALSLAWILLWILISIFYRKILDKGITAPLKSTVIFEEKMASGHSRKKHTEKSIDTHFLKLEICEIEDVNIKSYVVLDNSYQNLVLW